MTIAIYPGSFDPLTNGHFDIALRASKLFDKLIVAIYHAPIEKTLLFNTEERVALARRAFANNLNIEVMPYTGLTGDLAKRVNASVMVRGLRMGGDFEKEFNLAMMSRNLFPELENICLMASAEYQFVSSSMLKEAASLGANIETLVPANVAAALRKKFCRKPDLFDKNP
ncbi:MAG TPA: pantetheine-phosphate adenylyltransferase [Dehalococcoidales bacterium]|nr:pantetheine-phosphate adenylyltransferase [Dehalococcoidales bacterium]